MGFPDAGHFYELRTRLRGYLTKQRLHYPYKLSAPQEDAWTLLNEVDQLVKLLQKAETGIKADDDSEFAFQVRHTVASHFPAWRSK